MSDSVVDTLVDRVISADDGSISHDVRQSILDRIADSMLLAAFSSSEPTVLAIRRYTDDVGASGPCKSWLSDTTHSPRAASLLNGVAARVLDFNDAFFGLDSSHPSDVIPALFAVAEACDCDFEAIVSAIDVAYDVIVAFSSHANSRGSGWDHALTTGLGACCGVARLMGLTAAEVANAVSIYVTSSMTGRQTRIGTLTEWKAIAAPLACTRAIEACYLARNGVVGPLEPFLGPCGYLRVACHNEFDEVRLIQSLGLGRAGSVTETHLKLWPVGYVAHSALDAARTLHGRRGARAIRSVRIETFNAATVIMDGPDKRWPLTRETADHSLAYSVSAVLQFGAIDASVFSLDELENNGVREFVRDSVVIIENREFTLLYPQHQPTRISVEYSDSSKDAEELLCALGHARRPAQSSDLDQKFAALTGHPQLFASFRQRLDRATTPMDAVTSLREICAQVDESAGSEERA